VPDEQKSLQSFMAFAAKYGQALIPSPVKRLSSPASQYVMLQITQGRPEQHVIETIRNTNHGQSYSPDNTGSLRFSKTEFHCHFIISHPRYPDVMVHRVPEGCLEGTGLDKKNGRECKHHCSDMERSYT